MKRTVASVFFALLAMPFTVTALAADGAAIYKAKCTPCHGSDGQGTAMGPAFKDSQFIKTGTEAEIGEVITKGREGAAKKYKQFALGMPKQTMTEDEVKAVVAHLKTLAAKGKAETK
ncbi:MAG: cytochrome c [Deltaproteobacteria bacterium]|nr:cytochrome c [Deltaproteobacteria bacterium]